MVWIWGIALKTGFEHTSPKNRGLPQTWEVRVTGEMGALGEGQQALRAQPGMAWNKQGCRDLEDVWGPASISHRTMPISAYSLLGSWFSE